MADFLTFRDEIRRNSPSWLQHKWGERLLYSGAVVMDALNDILTLAVRAGLPTAGALEVEGALDIAGRDRRIPRGLNEPNAAYAARLLTWLDVHRVRGRAYSMLNQLRIHYAYSDVGPFDIALVNLGSGKRYIALGDGSPITTDTVVLPATTMVTSWMLVYQWPGVIPRDGVWDSPGVWDDGGVWDIEWNEDQIEDLFKIPADFNAAHSTGFIALLDDTTSDLWNFPGGALTLSDPPVWVGASDSAIIGRVPAPAVIL